MRGKWLYTTLYVQSMSCNEASYTQILVTAKPRLRSSFVLHNAYRRSSIPTSPIIPPSDHRITYSTLTWPGSVINYRNHYHAATAVKDYVLSM